LGNRKGIWLVKELCSGNTYRFFEGPGVICPNFWKNRLLKQKSKVVQVALVVVVEKY